MVADDDDNNVVVVNCDSVVHSCGHGVYSFFSFARRCWITSRVKANPKLQYGASLMWLGVYQNWLGLDIRDGGKQSSHGIESTLGYALTCSFVYS